jgi:3-dehydroquinate synthase
MSDMRIAATVPVQLGARSYDIEIGSGLLPHAASLLTSQLKSKNTAIVTDANVAKHHLAALQQSMDRAGIKHTAIIMSAGEATKSYASLAEVCDKLLAAGIERKDHIIALGGGVIGDLAGFAASVLRRGVNFVQIPTSLLAQVDSSVGGKTGINSPLGKNLVGAFHQPSKVLIDLDLLKTLPARQRAAGYAEIAKYGLLGDPSFFQWLDQNVEAVISCGQGVVDYAVRVSCETKARIVAEDETETGVRALLNLGHTFGHALEASTGYSDVLLHGEAVAIGMVQAFGFSEQQGLCAEGTTKRVAQHLSKAGLPVHTSAINAKLPPPAEMVEIMRQDKKASAGKLTFILTRGIGEAFIAKDVDDQKVRQFLERDMELK